MLYVDQGLKNLQDKQVWGEGELAAFLAAEGDDFLGGIANLSAAFLLDGGLGTKSSTGAPAPFNKAFMRIEKAIKDGHLPFHWRHTQEGRGRAFRRGDIQKWMKMSQASDSFSGFMREIFIPPPTPEDLESQAWAEAFTKHYQENPDGAPPPLPSHITRRLTGQISQPNTVSVATPAPGIQTLTTAPSPIITTDQESLSATTPLKQCQGPNVETRDQRLTRLDHELSTLSDRDRDRLLCRAVARERWAASPTSSIADIIKHPRIEAVTGGSWSGRDTLRNWIKDLDPRPPRSKPGPS